MEVRTEKGDEITERLLNLDCPYSKRHQRFSSNTLSWMLISLQNSRGSGRPNVRPRTHFKFLKRMY
jgi:hypothetical protein